MNKVDIVAPAWISDLIKCTWNKIKIKVKLQISLTIKNKSYHWNPQLKK